MKEYVIIVAGGKGLRMGTDLPKQFLPINGKAVILHTLEKFKQALPQAKLVLVLPEQEKSRWKELAKTTSFADVPIASGGENRFDSVKAGLALVPDNSLVAIHDAVRPFVSVSTVQNAVAMAKQKGSAIPVVDLKDSIREMKGNSSAAVNRSNYKLVQTPQCFSTDLIKEAYNQPFQSNFTDDASVFEASGKEVVLIEGNTQNIKITTQEDLKFAEWLANKGL